MKNIILAFLLLLVWQLGYSQNEYTVREYISQRNDTLKYRELLPENYNAGGKYPLVLFLHGAGERGSDNHSQLVHGSGMFTNPVNREQYPAIVLFPQCPAELFWSFDKRPTSGFGSDVFPSDHKIPIILQTVKDLLDQYIVSGVIDTDRIYIMGLSMGGMGTFEMVCRFPDMFAAAIPICGGINPVRLQAPAKKVMFRIYHGDKDDVVPVENSRKAYRALKEYGGDVEYIEFVGCNHGSWDPAFNQPDFLSWLFAQKKK